MDAIMQVILTIFPFVALGLTVWLMFMAYNDLLHRQVPARMMWAFIILAVPIVGPMFYLANFRDRR